MVKLSKLAPEEGTFVVVASFFDEDDAAVTPTSVLWTLTDSNGNVINNRENISVTPGTSVNIVLYGDDLKITNREVTRIVTVKIVYDSDYGTGLPMKKQCMFQIEDDVEVVE